MHTNALVGDWYSGGVEWRSGDEAGGDCREDERWVRDGRWGGDSEIGVWSGWTDIPVMGRVDEDLGRGEEGEDWAVRKEDVEKVESSDVV